MVRGAVPGAKRSTRIMRPPQQGQGGLPLIDLLGLFGGDLVLHDLLALSAGVGAAMICLMRAMVSARRLEASRP